LKLISFPTRFTSLLNNFSQLSILPASQRSMAGVLAANTKTPSPDPELGIEADEYDDNDSALGNLQSSTASISSSVMKFHEENGRTYHAHQDGKYLLPNDEQE
jgi:hypothetical protein